MSCHIWQTNDSVREARDALHEHFSKMSMRSSAGKFPMEGMAGQMKWERGT